MKSTDLCRFSKHAHKMRIRKKEIPTQYRISNVDLRISNGRRKTEFRIQESEYRIQNTEYRIQESEYRSQSRTRIRKEVEELKGTVW